MTNQYFKISLVRGSFLLIMLAFSIPSYSAEKENKLLLESFALEDGMPQSHVMDIAQDTTGFLWIATEYGLSKFNGESFQNYYFSAEDSFSLPNSKILDLYISEKGDLWVGTRYGFCSYDPLHDRFQRYIPAPDQLLGSSENVVISIGESEDHEILVLVESGILYAVDGNSMHSKLDLQEPECSNMLVDSLYRCWISSGNSIFCFDVKRNLTKRFDLDRDAERPDLQITDMLLIDQHLYITSYNSDLIKFNINSGEQYCYDLISNTAHTTALMKEGDNLFIGTTEGLKKFDLKIGEAESITDNFFEKGSLLSRSVQVIFRDNQSNLWIGAYENLCVSYRNRGFYAAPEYSNDFGVTQNIKLEVLNQEGKLRKEPFNKIEILPSQEIWEVFSICEDREENLWIGTYINGLIKYNTHDNAVQQYYPGSKDRDIPGYDVRDIEEDKDGNLWIIIHGKGIYVIDHNTGGVMDLKTYNPRLPEIVNQKWAFDLDFDQHNNLWVCGATGCFYYNLSDLNAEQADSSASIRHIIIENNVSSIFIASNDLVWVGTKAGIYIFNTDPALIKILNQDTGLPSNDIQAINEDRNGIIWCSTKKGISKIEHNGNGTFRITNFDTSHGLNSNNFFDHSTYFADDSLMYFGDVQGYTYFNPYKVSIDSTPPKVVLTNMYLFDKQVKIKSDANESKADEFLLERHIQYSGRVKIPEKYSMIGFEFSALNLNHSDKNQYQYRLKGYDDEWRAIGIRNKIYFNSLKPGNYTFLVKGSNSNNVWNETPASFEFTIVPPLWRSKFALLFYTLLIFFTLYYLMRIFIQKEKLILMVDHQNNLKELRTRFFMDISHELKTPLTLISLPLKSIINQYNEKKSAPSMEDILMINRNVTRLIRLMNQIFDFRKIELKKLDMHLSLCRIAAFTESILEYFDYQIRQKEIFLEKDFPSHEILFLCDSDKMDKILYNLISNALKYTPNKGEITISIGTQVKQNPGGKGQKFLVWRITDNGEGISEAKKAHIFDRFSFSTEPDVRRQGGTGIGLSIVKEFVTLHHGSITLDSRAVADGDLDSFTTVILEFPIDDNLYKDNQNVVYTETKIGEEARIVDEDYHAVLSADIRSSDEHGMMNLAENIHSVGEEAHSVLLIDDDKDICRLLEKEISSTYKVYIAYNGKEGLSKACEYLPDLIISDIMMPEVDGYELCKQLKTNVQTSHIPIILLTGKSSDEDELEGYSTGADAFIAKPFDLAKLIGRIDTLISNRIQLKRSFLSLYGIELKKVVPTNTDELFIQKFLRIVNENISDPDLGIDKITREIGVSRSLLYKKLNSIANISVKMFIRKIRLQKAAELLLEGELSVTDVALAVGFDSLPYFSKCFQEEYGLVPSKYNSGRK